MSVFENITKKVTETARAAAKKSGEIVEITKLSMSIGVEEDKIEKAYAEIGKVVFSAYNEGKEVGDTFKELCEKIKSYEDNIKDIKQKILELKNVKVCPGCAAELEVEIAYCPKCGTKQENPQPVEKAPEEKPFEKACPSCDAVNSLDSAFCAKCGAKLD